MNYPRLSLLVPLLFAACASPAPIAVIDTQHPASSAAPETSRPYRSNLREDAATQRTHELLAKREREMAAPATDQTSSGGQIAPKANQKGHEHQH